MKRGDIVLLSALLVVLLTSWLYISWLHSRSGDELVATVTQNGAIVRQINLNDVTSPYQFTVEDGTGGYNVVAVEAGRIRVVEANCAEQVDVRQGWISSASETLVCLPHRLVISISNNGQPGVDGIVR